MAEHFARPPTGEELVRALVAAGRLTPDQARRCVATHRERGAPIEQVLAELGLGAALPSRRPGGATPVVGGPTPRPLGGEMTPAPFGGLTPALAPAPARGSGRVRSGSPGATPPSDADVDRPDLPPDAPRRVGRYEVIAEIGRGGMGVVYRGLDPALGRSVAIKMILDPRGGTARERERFTREARAAARLRHPGVVVVHEVGEHVSPRASLPLPYLVMDWVEGETLETVHGRERLSPHRIAVILRELCLALEHAHGQGIVHRDIKPQNVLLDTDGRAKLVDFGLARDIDASSDLTQSGQLVGTPNWVAPEQVKGERSLVGPRSDVHAVGAILYWALVGHPPFDGDSLVEIVAKVIRLDPTPPRDLVPSVHPDLETLTLRCLEKDPARRLDAGELAEELRRFLDGEAIRARPPGALGRARRWARRHPARVAACAVVAAVAIGLPVSLLTSGALAVAAERRAAVERARDDAESAWVAFQRLAGADAPAGESLSMRRRRLDGVLAAALEAFGAAHRLVGTAPEDPAAHASLYKAAMELGLVAQETEQWSVAASAFGKAAELGVADAEASAALAQVEARRAALLDERRAAIGEALATARSGELDERAGAYDDALFTIVRYPEPLTVRLVAEALDEISEELAAVAGRSLLGVLEPDAHEVDAGEAPIEGLEAAVELWLTPGARLEDETSDVLDVARKRIVERERRRRSSRSDSRLPTGRALLATRQEREIGQGRLLLARLCCDALGRIGIRDDAVPALGRYLFAEESGVRASRAGIALCLLGGEEAARLVSRGRGRFNRSIAFTEQVERWAPRLGVVPTLEDETARGYRRRAYDRRALGDLDGALADLARAIELAPEDAKAWGAKGGVHEDRRELADARKAYDRAIELKPDEQSYYNNRALVLEQLGQLELAIADYTRAIEIDPNDAHAYTNRGVARVRSGDLDGAIADCGRALELAPDNFAAYLNRANAHADRGDLDRAIADLDRAIEIDPGLQMAWLNRAKTKRDAKDFAGALDDYGRAIELDPRDPSPRAERAGVRVQLGDLEGALGDLDRAIALDPSYSYAYSLRGTVRYRLGEVEAGLEDQGRALELNPDDRAAAWNRFIAREEQGDLAGAIDDLGTVIRVDPRDVRALLARARLSLRLKDHPSAIDDWGRALAIDPKQPATIWLARARALRAAKRFPEVVVDASGAIERDPALADAWLERGIALDMIGDKTASLADLEHFLEIAPDHPSAPTVRTNIERIRAQAGGS